MVCSAGSAGCPDRDIFVREYSMDPENIDIGVIAEEFGHAAFGLPDLYTTDIEGSISQLGDHGIRFVERPTGWHAAGALPALVPLHGWLGEAGRDRLHRLRDVKVGQLSLRPSHTEQGIKINLPDKEVNYINPIGTGNAWWSDVGDLLTNSIAHEFDLTGTTAPDVLLQQLTGAWRSIGTVATWRSRPTAALPGRPARYGRLLHPKLAQWQQH